jgi:DNA primase
MTVINSISFNSIKSQIKEKSLSTYLESEGFSLSEERNNKRMMCCPFHEDKKPSLEINSVTQTFRCWSCGDSASGDIIQFVMLSKGLDFVDALESLKRFYGLEKTEQYFNQVNEIKATKFASYFYQSQLKNPKNLNILDYLSSRGFSRAIIDRFQIGYAPCNSALLKNINEGSSAFIELGLIKEGENNKYDFFRDRIMFPIKDLDGNVRGFGGRINPENKNDKSSKYMNSCNSDFFNKSSLLFGLYEAIKINKGIKKFKKLYVVEGYADVLAFHQAGKTNVVSTCGTAISTEQIKQLFKYTDNICFVFDDDKAGIEATERAVINSLSSMTLRKHVSYVPLINSKDPANFIEDNEIHILNDLLNISYGFEKLIFDIVSRIKGRSIFHTRCLQIEKINNFKDCMSEDIGSILKDFICEKISHDERH